ncbi:MAG: hypothetical protein AB1439_10640 [candidate division FCPU426 bacterium]
MNRPDWPNPYRLLAHPAFILASAALMVIAYSCMTHGFARHALDHILAFQLSFTPARALRAIAEWGLPGVQAYMASMWLDFIFPLGYGLFISGLLARTLIRGGEQANARTLRLAALPWTAVGCDYLENVLHLWMLSRGWPSEWLPLLAASIAAAIKWGIMAFVILALLATWGRRLIERFFPMASRP